MKKLMTRILSLALAMMMCLSATPVSAESAKSVNIGLTSTVSTLNPLLMDATEVMKHATSIVFMPLVELNNDVEFVPQLAESITTEDNLTFTIKLQDAAAWSDGTPVTTKDVLYTFLALTNRHVGNMGLMQYAIEGVGDDGFVEDGATEISGIKLLDDKTLTITTKWPVALYTFMNNFGRYVLILPEHVLGDIPMEELRTHEWFNKPTVVSGPYFLTGFDLNHYIHFEANQNYWQGAPKIQYLNMNVLAPAQLLAGLQAGEIDLVQQTTADIPLEDYEAVKALPNVTTVMGTPITNQSIFFNVNTVPDVRIRQAFLYGLPREIILQELVHGNGELVDAFLCSASPYYSADLGVTAYDPEKAAQLIAEAKADGVSTDLTWHVNSGDATFVEAATFACAMMAELGLNIELKTVDLSTLMSVAGTNEMQVMAVQYTYAPVDPYTDMSWLLSDMGWTYYVNDEVTEALTKSQMITDVEEIRSLYLTVNRHVQQDVPMISAYVISTLGAISNRLEGASPDIFGTLINVHQWDVK